jgi:hypothetical protein
MLDLLIFFGIVTTFISSLLKGYFTYRFFVLEISIREHFFKFMFAPSHVNLKTSAFSIIPVLSKTISAESNDMKYKANISLIIFCH